MPGHHDDEDDVIYRHGLESVLFYAAVSGFKEHKLEAPSPWWCWLLGADGDSKVYINPEAFETRTDFPPEGVMMVTDHSRPDKNEPTGSLIWHDWLIEHVKEEAGLKDVEPLGGKMAKAKAQSEAEGDKSEKVGHGMDLGTVLNARKSLKSIGTAGGGGGAAAGGGGAAPGVPRLSLKSIKSAKTQPDLGAHDDHAKALKDHLEEHPNAPVMPFASPRPSVHAAQNNDAVKRAKSVHIHTEANQVVSVTADSHGDHDPNPISKARASLKSRQSLK